MKKSYAVFLSIVFLNVACSPVQQPEPKSPCELQSGVSPYSLEAIAYQQRCGQYGK